MTKKNKPQGIVLSLGSVNADFQVRVDEDPGSTTTMLAHDFLRLSGGKAANVAYLTCKLGASATLIAHVGDDDLQQQALQPLQEMGIDLTHVSLVKGASTAVSMIMVPPSGKKSIMLSTNANDQWQPEDAEEVSKAIEAAPENAILVVDYEIPPFIVKKAIETANARGLTIVLDPSPADRVEQELLSKVDFIVPDASEAETLTGIKPDTVDTALKAAKKLLKAGVQTALVKLEDGGCVVVNNEASFYIPKLPVDVVDTTGAGDAFTGALATALLEQHSLKEAACYAAAASLITVGTYGSQPAYPSREQLQEQFGELIDKVEDINEH